jgi:NAD(P)-dependent dehydrogenase (short-subunit alcohol dehydrogenase family)
LEDKKMELFKGKVAIVTGGGSGIGKALCLELYSRGATVIVADVNFEKAQNTVSIINPKEGLAKAAYLDVAKPTDFEKLINTTFAEFGRLDYLFNNAGIAFSGEFKDTDLGHWRRIVDINLWGIIYGCHYAYQLMIKQGFGHIVNTASLSGIVPANLTAAYATTKHAVVGLSMSLRSEAKFYNIKISVVCPGLIRTNIHETPEILTDYMKGEKQRKYMSDAKMTSADDCAKAIVKGVIKNRGIIPITFLARILWLLYRLFPELIPNLCVLMMKRVKKMA